MNAITDDGITIRSMMDFLFQEYCVDHLSDCQYYNYLRFLRNHCNDEQTNFDLYYKMREVVTMHPEIAPLFPGEKK